MTTMTISPPAVPAPHVPGEPTQVADVMTRNVITAGERTPLKDIANLLIRNKISAVPVIDERRHVLGIVSEVDLLVHTFGGPIVAARNHHRGHIRSGHAHVPVAVAGDLMTTPAVVTTPQASISSAARLAAKARVRRLPVVGEDGTLVGIAARSDLLHPLTRPDAEIHDEIQDLLDSTTDSGEASFTLHDGVVAMTGMVKGTEVKQWLVGYIRNIGGVIDVDISQLKTYRPSYLRPEYPGYL